MARNNRWKLKVQEVLHSCQEEFKKTTLIGKKMISASRTNSTIHESLEELGNLVFKAIKSGELKWVDAKVDQLIQKIGECQADLEDIEKEVQKIKVAPGLDDLAACGKANSSRKSKDSI